MTEGKIRAGRRRKPCQFNVWLVLNWICWRHHHFADTCWQKNLLTFADICWHLLTVADICWHQLLTRKSFQVQIYVYADIFWHLLTLADICQHLLNLASSNDATIFLKGSNHTGPSLAGAHILWVSNLSPKTCLGRTFLVPILLTTDAGTVQYPVHTVLCHMGSVSHDFYLRRDLVPTVADIQRALWLIVREESVTKYPLLDLAAGGFDELDCCCQYHGTWSARRITSTCVVT